MDTSDGLGSAPRGPAFTNHLGYGAPPEPPPPSLPPPPDVSPPRRRAPALITAAVVAAVLLVVTVSSVLASRSDPVTAPPAPRPRVSVAPADDDRIAFNSPDGTGQLIMVERQWVHDSVPAPQSGHFLRIEIELVCDSGSVDYEPADFQVFDRTGQLFEVSAEGIVGTELGVGTLLPGERIRGALAFDLPRGAATLMMSDRAEQTITALKVPD